MSLLRLPLVVGAAAIYHLCATAPAQSATNEQVRGSSNETMHKLETQGALFCLQIICWSGPLAETVSTLSFYFPDDSVPLVIRSLRGPYHPEPPSLLFVIAGTLSILGGLLRLVSYRTLGQFFTFQLSLRKSHALVTTGPYAYVRHPSYIGFLIWYIGMFAMHYSPDSWIRGSGVLSFQVVRWAIWAWAGFFVVGLSATLRRMPEEDRMLKRAFGKDWERWAERVRYRLVPGVY
ncbi:hypothetical protein BU15DRAFT_55695 [Melanogaster broomeanus]|nr:hypothetical protein BU15DRAFT_55695 [Melanogaster broomeanus]